MQGWEYKTAVFQTPFMDSNLDYDAFNASLNEMGKQGWELVSCFDTSHYQGETNTVIAIFKRPTE